MEKIIIHQEFAGYSEVFKPYGAQDDIPDDIPDDVPSIVDQIWQAGPVNAAIKSAKGASIVFDLALPPESDVDDDAPLYKSPKVILGVSHALAKTGDDKFVKVIATIRRIFDGHDEEMNEAIEIVTRIRAAARNEAIAQI
jgi:hypothetical protein